MADRWKTYTIVFFLIAVSLAIYQHKHGPKNFQKLAFKGVAKYVIYDIKGYPTVMVNGKEYCLSYVANSDDPKIYKDDTIIKQGGIMTVKVIRPHTKDTIRFIDLGTR